MPQDQINEKGQEQLQFIRDGDFWYLASYPKSGNTWLRISLVS